jgi:hypothetical protein
MGFVSGFLPEHMRHRLIVLARSSFEYMPWYAGKGEIRDYLEQLNKENKVRYRMNE